MQNKVEAICKILLLTVSLIYSSSAFANDLLKIEWYDISKNTIQFEISLSEKTKYKAYRSNNNKKLILDIVGKSIYIPKAKDLYQRKGLVEDIKISQNTASNLRIDFDLNSNLIDVKAASTYNKKKFVIKLIAKYNKNITVITDKNSKAVQIKKKIIIIDPGHGGHDCGATGSLLKLLEKNITLVAAKELKTNLENTGKYKVYLTRNDDRYLSLNQRKEFAKLKKGDIFISLHADAHQDPTFRGASVYTLSEEAYKDDKLIEKDTASKKIKGQDISKEKQQIADVILDLVRRDSKNSAEQLAQVTTNELQKKIALLKVAHRFAGFKVLNSVETPTILIELGFLSNKEEESLLNSQSYRLRIIRSIVTAVNKYFSNESNNNS